MNAVPMPAGPPPPSRCWNCDEPLSAGSVRCLFCGVVQQAAPVAAPAQVPATSVATPIAAPAVGSGAAAAPRTPSPVLPLVVRKDLGPAFSGGAATTGARIAAFTIDVLIVLAVTIIVGLLTRQAIYGAIAFVEMLVGLWVLEARTGLTLGNALLRIRVSREDAPFSPGIGRSFVRSIITGIGFLALFFGAWVVVASSAFDASMRGRSWADKAARTLVVAVPRRTPIARLTPAVSVAAGPLAAGVVPVGGVALTTPQPVSTPTAAGVHIIPLQEAPIVLAAPQVVSMSARPSMLDENSASASSTGVANKAFASSPVAQVEAPITPIARESVPESPDNVGTSILLIFDTGQREQLLTPVSVNLGRNPSPTEATDKLITITDPESSVSKTHLRLEHSRGTTWVTDGGSTNGTDLLSDEGSTTRITAGERVLVDDGTRVRVGNRTFTISILLGDNS